MRRPLRHLAAEPPAAEIVACLLFPEGLARRRVQRRQGSAVPPQGLHLVLGKVADAAVTAPGQGTAHGFDLARQCLQERRLARAIDPENADPVARVNAQRKIAQHGDARVSKRRLVKGECRIRHLLRIREGEPVRRACVHGRDALHPLERLDAALGLPRLFRFGTEPVDELLDMPDLKLLFCMLCRLQPERLGALPLEGGIASCIGRGLAIGHVHDLIADCIQEVPVVGYDEQGPRVALQPGLKPERRIEIEMVGRFVEQQQIRRRHEGTGKVQTDSPTAGELPVRLGEVLAAEAEPVQDLAGTRLGIVSPRFLELQMQVRQRFIVARLLGRLDLCLDCAQRTVAVQGEIEGATGTRLHSLVEPRETPFARAQNLTRLRQQAAADEFE